MSSIDTFLSNLVNIDKKSPPEISNIEVNDFAVEITIHNASVSAAGLQGLRNYFGDTPVKVEQLDGVHGIKLFLPRLKVPDQTYSVVSILKYIEQHQKQGLFMGLNDFGPTFLSFNDLTHAQLYGASGFGKSSFFRLLLSQTLAFHEDVMNYIIDPKQIDYRAFKDHPRIGHIASNRDEWYSLLANLLVEMSLREHVFSESFSTPPTSLQEYRQFRSELNRDDLPDFPRILLWIDEAHVLNDYPSEDLMNHLELLLKKGRAFGIHVICTTQRVTDMPSIVKSQASTVMLFYMHDSVNIAGLSLEEYHKNMTAIKGRLSFYNAAQAKFVNCQTPFIDANDSLGMAYGFGSKKSYPNRGLYRLRVSQNILQECSLPIYLCRGYNLKSLAAMTTQELQENIRTRDLYKYLLTDHFEIVKDTATVSPPADLMAKQIKENEDLLAEFNEMLGRSPRKSRPEASGSSPESESASEPASESKTLELTPITRSQNTPDYETLVRTFQNNLKNSNIDFSWCARDLFGNQGLLEVYKRFKGDANFNEHPVHFADLVYDDLTRGRLNKYAQEIQDSKEKQNKSPFLIVSGREGMGKRTLAQALAAHLDIPIRNAVPEDFIGFDSIRTEIQALFKSEESKKGKDTGSEANPSQAVKQEKPGQEFVVFADLPAALQFYRNCASHQIPILLNEWKTGPESIYNKVGRDFMALNEPHLSLELTEQTYKAPGVPEKLITVLLKKYGFTGALEKLQLKPFTTLGIPLTPKYLDALIERAHKKSLLAKTDFDWKVLNDVIDNYHLQDEQEKTGVTVILPTKDLKDLVSHEDTMSDLLDVIHKAKMMDAPRLQFAKKLRKAERMVALFSGPPGTGKSMAAEVIAKETGKELWICDFGKMQSAFVGETEKILSDLFYRAQTSKAVLLLDEADAFLMNRQGSMPSYMLKWINHLLNLIENFSGILILTSNHPEVMDPAFSRRIDIKARFFNPTMEQMKILLQNLLHPDAPLAADLNIDEALNGISLSGGLLRNAIERLIVKMERFNFTEITTNLLHSVLNETQLENQHFNEDEKRIGLI